MTNSGRIPVDLIGGRYRQLANAGRILAGFADGLVHRIVLMTSAGATPIGSFYLGVYPCLNSNVAPIAHNRTGGGNCPPRPTRSMQAVRKTAWRNVSSRGRLNHENHRPFRLINSEDGAGSFKRGSLLEIARRID